VSDGDLPLDGEATVAGVRLPVGRRLAGTGGPVLWATGEMTGAMRTWLALDDGLAGTSLVPVLLSGLEGQPERPWDSGELWPCEPGAVDGLDPAAVLREMWQASVPVPEEDEAETAALLAPYSRAFPGLATADGPRAGPGDRRNAVALLASLAAPRRLGLVAARRAADVPAIVGWQGAVNYCPTPAPLSAVLRSWEDRFGARLIHLGFDRIDLLVERPVLTQEGALAVAAEHFAFCLDNVGQGPGAIRRYATDLPGAPIWSFWWD
jgi:Domain of unknown function (DUF4253)